MALEHRRVIEHDIHPVDIYLREIIVILTCCHADLLLVLDTLRSIHEVPVAMGHSRPSKLHPVIDVRTVHVASALGGDHDHTVRSTGTIDRCRRCILEH